MASIKKLHKAVITLGDGREVEVERIGRGRFCTAWRNGSHAYLQVHEDDYAKEIMEGLQGVAHIPETESLGWFDGDKPYRLYRQPLYRKLRKAVAPVAFAHFRALQTLRQEAWEYAITRERPRIGFDTLCRFRELVEQSHLPASLKRAVGALVDETANYGDTWAVEIAGRNLAVHPERDELILLDPVFDTEKIKR